MQSLALRYRPTTFDDLVGQPEIQVMLRQMVVKRQVPTALLFSGSRGTGKTSTARILAAALNCEATQRPCQTCPSCKAIFDGTSFDLIEKDAASNGLVDDIRALCEQILYATGGNWRVVMLDEAQSMSHAAFNALLKTLEESPPNTVFVLLTTEPTHIPTTVASRCMPFTFRRLTVADITTRLAAITAAEGLSVEDALLTRIAERADGGMRDAIMTLDQITRAAITTDTAYTALLGEPDFGPQLLTELATGDITAAYATVAEQLTRSGDPHTISNTLANTLKDLLILRTGGTLTTQGAALDARRALADTLDRTQLVAALRVLWKLLRMRTGDDLRTLVDLAIIMIADVLHPSTPGIPGIPGSTAPPTPAPKLTLAQMAAMHRCPN